MTGRSARARSAARSRSRPAGPVEGRIHARTEVDVSAALAHVEDLRGRAGVRVTLTHLVGAALGRALRAVPEAPLPRRARSPRTTDDCTVAFAVDVEDGVDLGPVRVERRRPADDGGGRDAVEAPAGSVRGGTRPPPPPDRRPRAPRPPWRVTRPVLTHGEPARRRVGRARRSASPAARWHRRSLQRRDARATTRPSSRRLVARTPVYLAVGAVRDRPVSSTGSAVVRSDVLVATADHRVLDGAHAGRLQKVLLDLLADPARLDVPGPGAPA